MPQEGGGRNLLLFFKLLNGEVNYWGLTVPKRNLFSDSVFKESVRPKNFAFEFFYRKMNYPEAFFIFLDNYHILEDIPGFVTQFFKFWHFFAFFITFSTFFYCTLILTFVAVKKTNKMTYSGSKSVYAFKSYTKKTISQTGS